MSADGGAGRANRLIHETSPYLLQHAHNPVDWYPWGTEAFERARREDTPIFLSVGYSTCYWCHVMERESFENPDIARLMNEHFVCIKVDREERPDVDQLYMTAVQVLTQHGGWPMSVFLSPDLRPIEGGTYHPPEDRGRMVGFPTLLRGVADAWKNRRAMVDERCARLTEILAELAEPRRPESPMTVDQAFLVELVRRCIEDYDPRNGGFGSSPKFPRQTLLEMLLVAAKSGISAQKPQIQSMVLHALVAMASGGIRDHLGGAFHRYATDERWLVPHFEIMLYDNAMLAWLYVEAFRQTGQQQFAEVARRIIDFILGRMTSPAGAFYTALDAEVDAREGATYLWTREEIERLLDREDARVFCRAYGVDLGENFADPHHSDGRPHANVLYLPRPTRETAAELGLSVEQLRARLEPMRLKLLAARDQRKQPLLDTKILTGWNALMIRALSHAGETLVDADYLAAASRAADFLLTHHRAADGTIRRTSRDGTSGHEGFLDDYAFLAQSLLDLHEATAQPRWRAEAEAIVRTMRARFEDRAAGGFYFTAAEADDLIVRQKIATDSPLPSGNAIAAMCLMRLGQTQAAARTIAAFAQTMQSVGEGASSLVQTAMCHVRAHGPVRVEHVSTQESGVGDPAHRSDPDYKRDPARGDVALSAAWITPTHLCVNVTIAPGLHISAHDAPAGLAPMVLRLTPDHLVDLMEYPPGKALAVKFVDGPVSVYEGNASIDVRLKSPPPEDLKLTLMYQACSDRACFAAARASLTMPPAA